jgi:hypothetical protein
MKSQRRFPPATLERFARAKILGVRAGAEHKYTGVWVVVVENRVFVRSWSDKANGWYEAFRRELYGSIEVDNQSIPVRAVQTRSKRLQELVSEAYAVKYNTKGSQKWVAGFAEPERMRTTLEFVPA